VIGGLKVLWLVIASKWLHYDVTMKSRASSASPRKKQAPSRVPVTIRLPEMVVRQIDQDLDHRDIPLSRNNWLLEAAIEKLKRSGLAGSNGTK
jgi:hypothetical protein